ncbi:MAG: hypothetical protein ACSHWU_10070 [Marinicella sp.]
MFENNTAADSGSSKKIRYEPIERRRQNRRNTVADRRAEARAESEKNDRREQSDRRKK